MRKIDDGFLIESVVVDIDAPVHVVWQVLTDYARYPEWNPFTVRVQTTLEVGSVIDLYLPDPSNPGQEFLNREYIRVVDPPYYLRYDTGTDNPNMHAVREQWVSDLGDGRSSYRTTDLFTGKHAGPAFEAMGQWVKAGFDAVCETLKERAVAVHREMR
jgi:uncharacterized protein YndB with AHSA1/START domain